MYELLLSVLMGNPCTNWKYHRQTEVKVPRKLLCKWYHYTRCKQTYDIDQKEAWKEHVLSHYHNDAALVAAMGDTIPCWVMGCPVEYEARTKIDRREKFTDMLDHVYEKHMNSEQVDHDRLRNDDHFTIVALWNDIEDAYDLGNGIRLAEMEFLYREHVRPRGVTWSWAAAKLGEPEKEGTGKRSDLEPCDKRKEDRNRKRLAREAEAHRKDKGKCTEMGGPSVRARVVAERDHELRGSRDSSEADHQQRDVFGERYLWSRG